MASAASFLARALALPDGDGSERVEAQLDLATALTERGDLGRADELVEAATDCARELGDEALLARTLVERSHVLFHTDPEIWVQTARATTAAALPPLERAGNEIGLARAWMLVVIHDYIQGRDDDLHAALVPALAHARQTGDLQHVKALLTLALRSVLFAAMPVSTALAACDSLVADGADPAVAHGVRACLHAMAGRFDVARQEFKDGQAILEELGRTRQLAVHRFYGGSIELWAGDGLAAEQELRRAAKSVDAIGDRGTLSTVAALLAAALQLQGRPDEALRWAETSRRDASTADLISQVHWRTALARLVPDRSVELAAQAVEIASGTDWTVLQADATLCLRDVLLAADRADDAARAGDRAAVLYRAKGHAVGIRWAENPSRAASSVSNSRTVAGGT
jgi:tetratricopeptide (TPR) repeat protein